VVAVSDLLDYALIRTLQGRVADAQLADRRQLQAAGRPVRTSADEQQQAQSIIRQVVSEHLQAMLARREELPGDPSFETRLRAAIFSAIYGAGELQELLDNELVENIDLNGCEQTWVTYAGGIKKLWRPVAGSNEDLISIVQNLGAYAGMNARPFSPATPELDVRLQDGSRLSAVMSATETPGVSRRDLAGQVRVPVARGQLVQRHHDTTVARPSATFPSKRRPFIGEPSYCTCWLLGFTHQGSRRIAVYWLQSRAARAAHLVAVVVESPRSSPRTGVGISAASWNIAALRASEGWKPLATSRLRMFSVAR
jgi:hypothetical protein